MTGVLRVVLYIVGVLLAGLGAALVAVAVVLEFKRLRRRRTDRAWGRCEREWWGRR